MITAKPSKCCTRRIRVKIGKRARCLGLWEAVSLSRSIQIAVLLTFRRQQIIHNQHQFDRIIEKLEARQCAARKFA